MLQPVPCLPVWLLHVPLVVCDLQAAALPARSMGRLLKVAAYAVSIYATITRTNPPFRSPAGETSELVVPEKGLRALGEKVW